MKILVINCGSSSIKYQLFNMEDELVMVSGLAERIGEPQGKLTHNKFPDTEDELTIVKEDPIPDHKSGMNTIVSLLTDKEYGVIEDAAEILAVGHRVVHGGERFHEPVLISDEVIRLKHSRWQSLTRPFIRLCHLTPFITHCPMNTMRSWASAAMASTVRLIDMWPKRLPGSWVGPWMN